MNEPFWYLVHLSKQMFELTMKPIYFELVDLFLSELENSMFLFNIDRNTMYHDKFFNFTRIIKFT